MITKPMLAGTIKNISDVKYPILCSPKLDGIRCLKIGGKAVSRNFKPIPNHFVRVWIEKHLPDGVDGELILDGGTFQDTTSAVMTEDGEPPVQYHIFDWVTDSLSSPYNERMYHLKKEIDSNIVGRNTDYELPKPHAIVIILSVEINNEAELLEYEQKCLAEGYEGVMLRAPHGPYKCGRSTVKEGYLLKLKRFNDAEGIVVGYTARMHNNNELKRDVFGHAKRSTHIANKIPTGMLGALVVTVDGGTPFNIGTGFTEKQRVEFWKEQESLINRVVKFKFQKSGVKEAPRFPVFLGWRHPNDL